MRICMILEGCYPYVLGGVSSWTHQYIQAMEDHEFVLWCIGADSKDRDQFKYQLPQNVVEIHQVFLNDALRAGEIEKKIKLNRKELEALQYLVAGEKTDWEVLFFMFQKKRLNPLSVLMSVQFLEIVQRVCRENYPYVAFADFFHTVRSMMLPELYLLTQDIPKADLYHATATGYSGILGSLGKWKYQVPYIVTEHGIYTREREEELLRAKWVIPSFRKQWIGLFYNFSDCAYTYADKVTSLFEGARGTQERLGCEGHKLQVIANGVHYERFCKIPERVSKDGWIQIGAVVRLAKIKDVKTMIYAFTELKSRIPRVRMFILGDVDDEEYKEECVKLIEMLQVKDIIFTGPVNVVEYMEQFDFTILTSISEGQPLSVLESLAAGRPVVTTDVGCCRELVYGVGQDRLGQAGYVCPPMHREEIANAMERLCADDKIRIRMGEIGKKRVAAFYTHEISMNRYRELYEEVLQAWQE